MAKSKTDPVGTKKRCKVDHKNQSVCSTCAPSPPVQTRNSAPAHLRPDTAAWWSSVSAAYRLGSHQLRILTLAAEAWDRGVEAREAIAQVGSVYIDRFAQPRARPEVAIERDSRVAFARLVRELCLDVDSPGESGRPPRAAGSRQRSDLPVLDAEDRLILGLD
jgi:hypothetical protein